MTDLCHTTIYLEGAEVALRAVADEINSNGIDSVIFDSLDKLLFKENDTMNFITAEVVEIDGKPVLSVFVSTLDFDGTANWPKVLLGGAYFASHMIEAEEHITNDVAGKYFKPYKVVVSDRAGEECASFWTEAEAVRFVKDACPDVPKNLATLDEINEHFFRYDIETYFSMRTLAWHCFLRRSTTCQPVVLDIIECLLRALSFSKETEC